MPRPIESGVGGARSHGRLSTQVAASLRRRIYSGEWQAGDQLPVEAALTAEYRVSRSTVRAAIRSLEDSGLLAVRPGVGTFVSPLGDAVRIGLQDLRSMTSTIRDQGYAPGALFGRREILPATASQAADLQVKEGEPVAVVERTLTADRDPIAFDTAVLSLRRLPPAFHPSQVELSVFALLARYEVVPAYAVVDLEVTAKLEAPWTARAGGPYLGVHQTIYLQDGEPLIRSHTYFLDSRFRFSLVRVANGGGR